MDMFKARWNLLNLLALFLALVGCTPTAVEGLECILTVPPQTRTFQSFSEYRTNRKPFSPSGRGFEGNHVNFAFQTLDRLITNMFKTYDSVHIVDLNLTSKGIQRVDTDAFTGLSCLHVLDLSRNNITDITEGMFRGLDRLRTLDLSANQLSNILDSSLRHFESLEILNLADNYIKSIPDPFAFFNVSTLTVLNLNGNEMDDFPEGLDLLTHLKVLRMASNRLNSLTLSKLANVSDTIEVLDVGNNDIVSINFTANDSSLTFGAMKSLDISNNSLYILDVHKLKSAFPGLKRLYLEDNMWECHVLSVVIHELDDAKIVYHDTNALAVANATKNKLGNIGPGLVCRSGAILYPESTNGSHSTATASTNVSLLMQRLQVETARNWTALTQALHDIVRDNSANARMTYDILREVGGLYNVLVLMTVIVSLCMAVRVCLRAGICSRCADYDRICERNHSEFYIDHERDGESRRARRLQRSRERRNLLDGSVRCAAYRAT